MLVVVVEPTLRCRSVQCVTFHTTKRLCHFPYISVAVPFAGRSCTFL